VPVDVVNVFRSPDPPANRRELRGDKRRALWCQFVVIKRRTARKIAEDGCVNVIIPACLNVEHSRYVVRIHWLASTRHRNHSSAPAP